ncbi:hypothetical protein [Raoultibacter phocaeensis]|uniref:hypothetical protein n=1 Tax=Raoultibacter phocaeensis TaxID=2479841 RepID=UPI001119942F|nr:hypothetical protein [Raoultibacter phocaeensis]
MEKIGDQREGLGTVHRTHDVRGNEVAIKYLSSNDEEARQISFKEIRTAERLNHPFIVKVLDKGHDGNQVYCTMPLYACSLVDINPQLYDNPANQYQVISNILTGVSYICTVKPSLIAILNLQNFFIAPIMTSQLRISVSTAKTALTPIGLLIFLEIIIERAAIWLQSKCMISHAQTH